MGEQMVPWPWSIVVVIIYVGAAIYLIVNPEEIGSYRGWAGHGVVTAPTPGCMIRAVGCCMLAVFPAGFVGAWNVVAGIVIGILVAIGLYMAASRFLS